MTHVYRWLFLAVLIWCNSAFATEIDPVYGIELVSIKGGCFRMGDSSGDVYLTGAPAHQVCIEITRRVKAPNIRNNKKQLH